MSRDIVHGIEIHAEPKAVYDTIATRSGTGRVLDTGCRRAMRHEGGELTFGFAEAPIRLPMRVARLDPTNEIAMGQPGRVPLLGGDEGRPGRSSRASTARRWSSVRPGFPDDEPEYEFGSVSLTWALIVARLKEVVESGGVPNPALS